jgi:hypothetical protein
MEHSRPQRRIHTSLFREAFEFTISRKPVASARPKTTYPEDDGVSRISSHEGSVRGAPSEVSPLEPASFDESFPEPQTLRSFQATESPTAPENSNSRQKGLLQPYQAIPVDSSSLLYSNAPPSRSAFSTIFSQRHNHGWFWELLSCLFSFLSLIAIIIILKHYDGQPIQNAPQSVTLNSLLAIFTTLAKVGLMFPLAEALSQLKWVWFREAERPLIDFQTFDEATRGPIGGLRLLGMLKGRYVALKTGFRGDKPTITHMVVDIYLVWAPRSRSWGSPSLPSHNNWFLTRLERCPSEVLGLGLPRMLLEVTSLWDMSP